MFIFAEGPALVYMSDKSAIISAMIVAIPPTLVSILNFFQNKSHHKDNKEFAEGTREAVEETNQQVEKVSEVAGNTNAQVTLIGPALDGRLQQFLAVTEKLAHSKGFYEGVDDTNAKFEETRRNRRHTDVDYEEKGS